MSKKPSKNSLKKKLQRKRSSKRYVPLNFTLLMLKITMQVNYLTNELKTKKLLIDSVNDSRD